MISSIRGRITAWYGLVFAAFLGVLALASYLFLGYTSLERVDEFLAESGATIASAIEFEHAQGAVDSVAIRSVVGSILLPDVAVSVYDEGSRNTIGSFEGLRRRSSERVALEQALDRAPLANVREPSLRTLEGDSREVRVLMLPYELGNRRLVIAVAQVMTARSRMLRDARLALGVGLPLVLVLASFGGWWLAGRGLAPVDVMSGQARAIGASNLHQRLPVVNPSDELGRLATTFNELLERLDRAFNAQGRFAADASHELRTPVAVISGEAELALSRDDRPAETLAAALRVIHAESRRLRSVVDDLFLLARADGGEPVVRTNPLHLHDLAEDSATSLRSLAAAREITLRVEGDDDAPIVGDEQLLRRAIDNLVSNAVKYTPVGGTVTLAIVPGDAAWHLDIRDTGPGVPEADRALVFERFFRTDTARASRDAGGAGLGLPIARWVARAHHGDVILRESSASGSTFRLTLPRANEGAVSLTEA